LSLKSGMHFDVPYDTNVFEKSDVPEKAVVGLAAAGGVGSA
jgi:hypothetical protein